MRKKSKKPSTYSKYALSHVQMTHLLDFMHRDNKLVDTMIISGKVCRLTKLQDGSTNIEVVENSNG